MMLAAWVWVLIVTSWRASPRLRVMSSPGRASEPTARIEITSGPIAVAWASCDLHQGDLGRLHRGVGDGQGDDAEHRGPASPAG